MRPGRKITSYSPSSVAKRKRMAARREAGQCLACRLPAVTGRRLCAPCNELNASRTAARIAAWIAAGLCRECGWPSSRGTRCMTCRAKRRWLPNRRTRAPWRMAKYQALRERAVVA